ncbi:MAG: hypothetical protein HUJ61_01625 [Bacilli bacterium]|nr:hypothetical protein [Bacilli bacterium]
MLKEVINGLSKDISVEDYYNYLYSGLFNQKTFRRFECIHGKVNDFYIVKNNCVDTIDDAVLNKLGITRDDFELIRSTPFFFIGLYNLTNGTTIGFKFDEHCYSNARLAGKAAKKLAHPVRSIAVARGVSIGTAIVGIIAYIPLAATGTFDKIGVDRSNNYSMKYSIYPNEIGNAIMDDVDGITYICSGVTYYDNEFIFMLNSSIRTAQTNAYTSKIKYIKVYTYQYYDDNEYKIDGFKLMSRNAYYSSSHYYSNYEYEFRPRKTAYGFKLYKSTKGSSRLQRISIYLA